VRTIKASGHPSDNYVYVVQRRGSLVGVYDYLIEATRAHPWDWRACKGPTLPTWMSEDGEGMITKMEVSSHGWRRTPLPPPQYKQPRIACGPHNLLDQERWHEYWGDKWMGSSPYLDNITYWVSNVFILKDYYGVDTA
jgi:hypothetical protein